MGEAILLNETRRQSGASLGLVQLVQDQGCGTVQWQEEHWTSASNSIATSSHDANTAYTGIVSRDKMIRASSNLSRRASGSCIIRVCSNMSVQRRLRVLLQRQVLRAARQDFHLKYGQIAAT
jgi:hypothetical protein